MSTFPCIALLAMGPLLSPHDMGPSGNVTYLTYLCLLLVPGVWERYPHLSRHFAPTPTFERDGHQPRDSNCCWALSTKPWNNSLSTGRSRQHVVAVIGSSTSLSREKTTLLTYDGGDFVFVEWEADGMGWVVWDGMGCVGCYGMGWDGWDVMGYDGM